MVPPRRFVFLQQVAAASTSSMRACWALLAAVTAVASLMVPVADVGVVGAGPAGLTLCHALRAEGYSVRVFERRDCFRPVGAAVFLHPFACNSLRAVSPELEQQLLEVATVIDTLSFNALGDAPSFKFDKMGEATRVLGAPFLAVRFWDMLCALKLGLPDECFAFDHQLERFEQHGGEEGGVTLHFAEGKPPCHVRYLIDAGGIRSTTRKQLTGDSPIPWLRATFSLLPADRVECNRDSAGGGVPGELGFVAGDSLSVTTMGLSDGGVMWSQANLRDEPTARIGTSEAALRTCLDARYHGDESWPATLGKKSRPLLLPL
jgi:2-polyprenyl-6-methoxyphenol hydroxylase-like FAD-dependent oxidoreductase